MNKYLTKIAAGYGGMTNVTDPQAAADRFAGPGTSKGPAPAAKPMNIPSVPVSTGAKGMRMNAGETGAPVLDASKSGFFNK